MQAKILSRHGYGVLKSCLTQEDIKKIQDQLTVAPTSGYVKTMQDNKFSLFKESDTRIYVPKSYGLKKFGIPTSNKIRNGSDINVNFNGDLREEQQAPVNAFLNACKNQEKMGGILNLPCAFGKTAIAIYTICKLAKKTLVIVHKEFLMKQWQERISAFAPNAKVGIIQGKTIDIEGKDIVIGLLQSLSMKDYPKSVFETFGYVIIDEIHRTGAEVFSRALSKVNFEYSLGLSATLTRKDGLSKVFMWYIGDVVYKINKRSDTVIVKIKEFECDDYEYSKIDSLGNGKVNMSKMINNICEYEQRATFISEEVTNLLHEESNRKILILSDRRTHLQTLYNLLSNKFSCGFYYGGLKQEILKESEKCTIILGTFQMSQEGLDIKGLDTLVLASPKSDIVQSCGRILRDKPNERKNTPMIIDIVDDFSIFSQQAKKRKQYYKKCKYSIIEN